VAERLCPPMAGIAADFREKPVPRTYNQAQKKGYL
jgi:hypothetical protein